VSPSDVFFKGNVKVATTAAIKHYKNCDQSSNNAAKAAVVATYNESL